MASPVTLPSWIGVSSCVPATVPVSLAPSCLKVKVFTRWVPSGVVNSALHLPVTSAAMAPIESVTSSVTAHSQMRFLMVVLLSGLFTIPRVGAAQGAKQGRLFSERWFGIYCRLLLELKKEIPRQGG